MRAHQVARTACLAAALSVLFAAALAQQSGTTTGGAGGTTGPTYPQPTVSAGGTVIDNSLPGDVLSAELPRIAPPRPAASSIGSDPVAGGGAPGPGSGLATNSSQQ